ncbi:MAG TPA: SRPBCC family protein [Candidatus Limnocylindrales bacterium]|nr:SRPBCC family protein [Candidatus Limnocylindrales bacterium]
MPQYRFVTLWRLQAPIERVFAEIDDAAAWPTWWSNVRSVELLEPGGDDGIGARYRTTFVGKLPYELRFDLRVTLREPPTSLVGVATGELEGTGEWTLWTEEDWTVVRYVWSIRTTARWMNLLAPLPFVDEIFRLNHHAVMRNGLIGIRQRLGGIAGTYARED